MKNLNEQEIALVGNAIIDSLKNSYIQCDAGDHEAVYFKMDARTRYSYVYDESNTKFPRFYAGTFTVNATRLYCDERNSNYSTQIEKNYNKVNKVDDYIKFNIFFKEDFSRLDKVKSKQGSVHLPFTIERSIQTLPIRRKVKKKPTI